MVLSAVSVLLLVRILHKEPGSLSSLRSADFEKDLKDCNLIFVIEFCAAILFME